MDLNNENGRFHAVKGEFDDIGREIIIGVEEDPQKKNDFVVVGNYSKEELKNWLDSTVQTAESVYIAKSLAEIGGIGITIDGEAYTQMKSEIAVMENDETEYTQVKSDIAVMGNYSKDKLKEWLNGEVQNSKSAWTAQSIEEVNYILRDYEIETMSKFIAHSSNKNFGKGDVYTGKHFVRWHDNSITYDGIPFSIMGTKRLHCHHEKDRNLLYKETIKEKKDKLKMADPNFRKRKKVMIQESKKCGCTADVKITEVIKFPGFKIGTNTKYNRRSAAKLVKNALKEKSLEYEREFSLILPPIIHHSKHVTKHMTGEVADTCQTIFPRLIKEINKNAGIIKNVDEMKRKLEVVVKQELFPDVQCPQRSNKQFFPKLKTIRSHMVKALKKLCYSKIDQECLDFKVEEWKKDYQGDNFYFRPKGKVNNKSGRKDLNYQDCEDESCIDDIKIISAPGESLLFVYQAAWQKRLLRKYGNELCFLDATYKTTGYALPMFFLVVKTNVDYQVVGTFITEGESSENVIDGLDILKEWNADLNPMFAMVDLSVEEINAIETLYPGCDIFISDFHREQAWERWLSAHVNGCFMIKDQMIPRLRDIARALSEEELEIAINNFQNCEEWKNPAYSNMVTWFNEQWMPVLTRWVWFYRQECLIVNINTNDGVERQNEVFKYEYLKKHLGTSLTGLLTVLIEDYFPESYESYCDANTKCSSNYRRYNTNIPSFLHNKPQSLVRHCLSEMYLAANIDLSGVHQKGIGRFVVLIQNEESLERYELFFGDEKSFPKCTCMEWKQTSFPCKHFFAIFRKFPAWNWNSLSVMYIESPFMTLDREVNPILDQGNVDIKDICNELLIPYNENEVEIATSLSDGLPCAKTFKANKASLCREISNSITSDTFLIGDNIILEEIYQDLLTIQQKARTAIAKRSDNALIPEKPKRRKPNFTPVAISMNKKPVGEKLNISLPHGNDIVENVLASNSSVVDTKEVQINDTFSHPFQSNLHDLVALIESETRNLILTNDEISLIKNGNMLTDAIINVAQNILKKQFGATGFQDTLLSQSMEFKEYKTPFIQILHNNTFHWIAISSIDCPSNAIYYYDCMYHGKIKNNILQQICTIYNSEGNNLTIKICSCQQQGNIDDCGIYVVAFCYYILKGVDISKLHLKESSLREHFLKCILEGHFSDFPLNNKPTCMSNENYVDFDLCCRCKLPWLWYHNKQKDIRMAQCELCDEWYHQKCENVPDYIFFYKDRKWSCKDCESR